MTELAVFVGLLLRTAWPSLSPLGLQLGMTVGLFTPVPYATIDYPNASNRRYWTRMSLFLGLSAAAAALFAHGRPYLAGIVDVVVAFLSTVGGLWFGLTLGNRVNHWIVALRPVFALLRKLGTTLTAFAVGYLSIIVLFSTFFAALWRVQGPDAFSGLPKDPTLPVFLYFSLVTATTIGYGDIVPQSASARSLAGLESISSLAWTLVVFAALSVQFASRATESTPKDKDDKHYDGN
ncbi:MAG TPA: potassium channel family protein [Terriglobales bacterium]